MKYVNWEIFRYIWEDGFNEGLFRLCCYMVVYGDFFNVERLSL